MYRLRKLNGPAHDEAPLAYKPVGLYLRHQLTTIGLRNILFTRILENVPNYIILRKNVNEIINAPDLLGKAVTYNNQRQLREPFSRSTRVGLKYYSGCA
jgi:hypothetical protein